MFRCSGSALSGALDFCSWPSGATLRTPEWSTAGASAALKAASCSGWAPRGPASFWECRAAQSRQARPGEAQEPSWGAAKRAL
eukprot:scaffold49166_cov58-Phaeocystis_antarctica.AAC.1